MIFLHGVLQPTLQAGGKNTDEDACWEGYHGNTDFLGVIALGVFLGIVIISLLSMAQKGEQIYELMYRGERIGASTDSYSLPASEIRSPASNGEVRADRDLSSSVTAS